MMKAMKLIVLAIGVAIFSLPSAAQVGRQTLAHQVDEILAIEAIDLLRRPAKPRPPKQVGGVVARGVRRARRSRGSARIVRRVPPAIR